jgi:hypothetical protein
MYEDLKGQLADYQHGFVKGRSTVSNLLEYSSFVLKSIKDGCRVDSIYMDYSEAFNKVRHRLLLKEIRLMLSHPVVSGWVLTFLQKDRNPPPWYNPARKDW